MRLVGLIYDSYTDYHECRMLKVWDYQNKTCVQTLEGHTHNVSVTCFHPTLPLIISGSEDGTVRCGQNHHLCYTSCTDMA